MMIELNIYVVQLQNSVTVYKLAVSCSDQSVAAHLIGSCDTDSNCQNLHFQF